MSVQEHSGEARESAPAGVPPVVAVMVTSNPGPWFEEALTALRNQDYPNLAVLIIDAASVENPLERIAATLPDAYVRRLSTNPGYAAAANRALRIVQGASHLVLCHDDIAPEPDAIRRMMEEAFRTNAGIVTPKIVGWSDPRVLLELGGTVDVTGAFIPGIEAHDLDQGQHDTPSEVFAAGGACMLVRSDLFTALGGFDAAMTLYGEDVDLCWRAQIAGARIHTAPQARVRHVEAATTGMRLMASAPDPNEEDADAGAVVAIDQSVLRRRHQLRTVLKVHRGPALLWAAGRVGVLNIVELILGVVLGRPRQVGAITAAWTWNIAHWRGLLRLRRQVSRSRAVKNRALKRRFGSARARLADAARDDWQSRRELLRNEHRGRELATSLRRLPVAVWALVLFVWLVGSRELIDGGVPTVGRFAPLPSGPLEAFERFFARVPVDPFGAATTASPADLLVGVAGTVFLGAMGLLQKAAVLAMLPIGILGVVRLARPLKSQRATLTMVVAYVATPLPYDSIGLGRWEGLVCYAAAPWMLNRLLRAHGADPYVRRTGALHVSLRRGHGDEEDLETLVVSDLALRPEPGDGIGDAKSDARSDARLTAAAALLGQSGTEEQQGASLPAQAPIGDRLWFLLLRRIVPLGLLLAVVGTLAPHFLIAAAIAGLGLIVGDFLAGRPGDRWQTLGVVTGALLVALVLLAPAFAGGTIGWAELYRAPVSTSLPDGFGALLRFHGGGVAGSWLTFGLILAALPGLLIGKEWRFHQSVRLWTVTLLCVGVSWLSVRGWVGSTLFDPRAFVSVAAAAVALNAGVGAVALQTDLRRYRFGWRQALPAAALAGLLACTLPVVGRSADGRWHAPGTTTSELLSWMSDQTVNGSFRAVWLGDADVVPAGARVIAPDLSAAIAVDSATPVGPGSPRDGGRGEDLLAAGIAAARSGDTVQLGHMLAPLSVRYLIVPLRNGGESSGGLSLPPPPDLEDALNDQLDLRKVDTDPSVIVYENTGWAPVRAVLPPEAVLGAHSGNADAAQLTDLSDASAVLGDRDGLSTWTGVVPPGTVYVAQDASSNAWRYVVDGRLAAPTTAFGWGSTYATDAGGSVRLHYRPALADRVAPVLNAVAWLLVALLAIHYRTRRGRYA